MGGVTGVIAVMWVKRRRCRREPRTGPSTCSASSRGATIRTRCRSIFPGGAGAKVWTFVTYSLLHANLSHIFFNVLWLLPFGSALARRFGAFRFFIFMAMTAAAGAFAHLLTHEHG